MGGMTTALAPASGTRVLGVSGMNYGNGLVQRSVDFAPFGKLLAASYTDSSMTSVILDLSSSCGTGRSGRVRPAHDDAPLRGHALAYGADGDRLRRPSGEPVRGRGRGADDWGGGTPAGARSEPRSRQAPAVRDPAIAHYPFTGSAIVLWDGGPGQVQPPPFANLAPVESTTNQDPHEFRGQRSPIGPEVRLPGPERRGVRRVGRQVLPHGLLRAVETR